MKRYSPVKYHFYPDPRIRIRERILERVRAGRLTPQHAEIFAKIVGIEHFAGAPDLNPFHEASWSMAMTIAWIRWRDECWVVKTWPRWSENNYHWAKVEGDVWDLQAEKTITAGDLFYSSTLDLSSNAKTPSPQQTIEGWKQLVAAAAQGHVRAYEEKSVGNIQLIDAGKWLDGFPDQTSDNLVSSKNSDMVTARRVQILTGDVLRIWPPKPDVAAEPTSPETIAIEMNVNADLPENQTPREQVVNVLRESSGKLLSRSTEAERIQAIRDAVQVLEGWENRSISDSTIRRGIRDYRS